ncbi:MAG: hypothetical protein AAFS07_10075 [Pseudomonadota bacterium]
MRRLLSPKAAFVLILCAVTPIHALQASDMRSQMRQIDTNKDRALQFSEIEAMRARVFDRADGNADGVLDKAEIDALRQKAGARSPAGGARLDDLDTDGDGTVTRTEFAVVPPHMRAADTDGNETLTRSELIAAFRN